MTEVAPDSVPNEQNASQFSLFPVFTLIGVSATEIDKSLLLELLYWFPGWSHHGHYNRQPNDDGLSEQDCVEVRRAYGLPAAAAGPARLASATFAWNDRDCSTANYFVCERLQTDEPLEDSWLPECNRTVILSRNQPKASVSSPGFPRQYPDNANCDIDIIASAGYKIILDFEELVLEDEPS
nr:unnamed protein product [Callosobruchus chinensis]